MEIAPDLNLWKRRTSLISLWCSCGSRSSVPSPTVDEMSTSSEWLSGPKFLKKKEELWPCDPTVRQLEPLDGDPEIKRET